MIACIGKNNRCKPLFQALSELDERFRFIGLANVDQSAKVLGALMSASPSKERTRQLLEFSPPVTASLERSCVVLLDSLNERPEAILYWGATNLPVSGKYADLPYYIVTDGPYDPDDPIYPDIWQPGKWAKRYLDLQRRVFEGARHIFTLSEWARQKVIKVHSIDAGKVTRIGWGPLYCIGPPLDRPVKGKKIVLSVGNHWHIKGMDLVAEAGALLHQEDKDVETIIIGDPHGMAIQPQRGVTLIPHSLPVSAVHAIMRQASVLVVASRFDASPHVIPEAYQYGVPVVGSNVCGIPEVLQCESAFRVFGSRDLDLSQVLYSYFADDFQVRATIPTESFDWIESARNVIAAFSNITMTLGKEGSV